MKLAELDARHGHALHGAVQWLETLIKSPLVPWADRQHAAAKEAASAARKLLDTDLLTLGGETVRARIDRLEREVAAAPVTVVQGWAIQNTEGQWLTIGPDGVEGTHWTSDPNAAFVVRCQDHAEFIEGELPFTAGPVQVVPAPEVTR